jgi:hypothetical protein
MFKITDASTTPREPGGITTGYGLDDRGVGVQVPVGSKIFFTSSEPAVRPTQSLVQWVPVALSPEIKRQRREADHSPTSTEVKKMWIYKSTHPPPLRLQGVVLNKLTAKLLISLRCADVFLNYTL